MHTKIKLLKLVEITGALLLLAGIMLGFAGAEILHIPFIRIDMVPFAVGFCGVVLFIAANSGISYEKTKTKDQEIEEKDERLLTIERNAKSKGFDIIMILLPFALLSMAIFGYMNKVSFFALAGMYFISFGYQKYLYWKYQRE